MLLFLFGVAFGCAIGLALANIASSPRSATDDDS